MANRWTGDDGRASAAALTHVGLLVALLLVGLVARAAAAQVNVTSGEIVASLTMPRAYWVDGQYRSLPRDSVAGESASAPFPLVV